MLKKNEMKQYHYLTNCVSSSAIKIQAMVDNARGITYNTIQRNCQGLQEWSKNMGYNRNLTLKNDWAVSFYKSKYNNKPCYYIRHSSIEYIWRTKND